MDGTNNKGKNILLVVIGIAIIVVIGLFIRKGAATPVTETSTGADQTQADASTADSAGTSSDATTADTSTNKPTTMNTSEQNVAEGKAFLAENKTKEGVKTTASGLQYKILTPGTGPKPTAKNTVKVNYEGRLINGTVFDSSYKRNEPVEFPLSGVIAGWTEGVQLMPTGSKFQFYIPANLAYGETGAGGLIGPNATLIFDVELLAITK